MLKKGKAYHVLINFLICVYTKSSAMDKCYTALLDRGPEFQNNQPSKMSNLVPCKFKEGRDKRKPKQEDHKAKMKKQQELNLVQVIHADKQEEAKSVQAILREMPYLPLYKVDGYYFNFSSCPCIALLKDMMRNEQKSIKMSNVNSRITTGAAHHHMNPRAHQCVVKPEKLLFLRLPLKGCYPAQSIWKHSEGYLAHTGLPVYTDEQPQLLAKCETSCK